MAATRSKKFTTTLAPAVREQCPSCGKQWQPDDAYEELAELVRYEYMQASSTDPQFGKAMSAREGNHAKREKADFILGDLQENSVAAGQFLGHLISALPGRDAGSSGATRSAKLNDSRFWPSLMRSGESCYLYGGAQEQLSRAARSGW